MVFDGSWWLMVVLVGIGIGSSLWFLVVLCGSWWFLVVLCGSWLFFMVLCGSWWFLVALSRFWWFLGFLVVGDAEVELLPDDLRLSSG